MCPFREWDPRRERVREMARRSETVDKKSHFIWGQQCMSNHSQWSSQHQCGPASQQTHHRLTDFNFPKLCRGRPFLNSNLLICLSNKMIVLRAGLSFLWELLSDCAIAISPSRHHFLRTNYTAAPLLIDKWQSNETALEHYLPAHPIIPSEVLRWGAFLWWWWQVFGESSAR